MTNLVKVKMLDGFPPRQYGAHSVVFVCAHWKSLKGIPEVSKNRLFAKKGNICICYII